MRQHLLRVERPVVEFERLIAAVRHQGGRVGWLELAESPAEPCPPSLAAAAERGVLRAVAAGGGRTVAVKPMRGDPVLRDLLREHFRGCLLVLVETASARGGIDLPHLEPRDGGWIVRAADHEKAFDTDELVTALRRPRPWPGTRPER